MLSDEEKWDRAFGEWYAETRPDPKRKADHYRWWRWVLDPPYRWVYVISESGSEAIKVGVATDLGSRLGTLRCGNPRELNLLHIFPAGYDLEARIHRYLAPDRLHGEWFEGPLVANTLPELGELAEKMIAAYDGSNRPPSWKGFVNWSSRSPTRQRRKADQVKVRRVDPSTLR